MAEHSKIAPSADARPVLKAYRVTFELGHGWNIQGVLYAEDGDQASQIAVHEVRANHQHWANLAGSVVCKVADLVPFPVKLSEAAWQSAFSIGEEVYDLLRERGAVRGEGLSKTTEVIAKMVQLAIDADRQAKSL